MVDGVCRAVAVWEDNENARWPIVGTVDVKVDGGHVAVEPCWWFFVVAFVFHWQYSELSYLFGAAESHMSLAVGYGRGLVVSHGVCSTVLRCCMIRRRF